MISNIFNYSGAKVEQLSSDNCTFLEIANDGLGAVSILDGSTSISVEANKIYQIDRITLELDKFVNEDLPAWAFPRWEQFAFEIKIDCALGNGVIKSTTLFKDMAYGTSDGVSNTLLFKEPFIFTTNAGTSPSLIFNFKNIASVFINITGMAVPPVLGQQINVNGIFALEGFSLPFETGSKLMVQSQLKI